MIDLDQIDFVCVFGLSNDIYEEIRPWLDKSSQRRLVFVTENPNAVETLRKKSDSILLFQDTRVKIYQIESPIQIELLAKKIAWQAVFLSIKIIEGDRGSPFFESFKKWLEYHHLGADLTLSDAADCGLSLLKNTYSQLQRPTRSALLLKDAFIDLPAVIVGAGPSLAKNKSLLKEISEKALVLAGGAALNAIDFSPHFAGSIDSQSPYTQFKQGSFWEVPFCFQSRMNRENFSLIHGDALLVPDGHFSFINWLNGQDHLFHGGWTVGNFLTSLALFWGCNPIVFIGMDFCYQNDKKYAHRDTSLDASATWINGVLTQRDWIMARQWTQELAEKNLDKTFINATEGGMGLSEPIQTRRLSEVDFGSNRELTSIVHEAIQSIPFIQQRSEGWEIWKKSLQASLQFCKQALISSDLGIDKPLLETEITYEKFLSPLWDVWLPVFQNELDTVSPQQLRLNQLLFFQRIIEEQLDVLR